MKKLRYCQSCDQYTLNESCSEHGNTISAYPPKFSPQDKYAKYRAKELIGDLH